MVCLNSSFWPKIRESLLHSLFHSFFLLPSKEDFVKLFSHLPKRSLGWKYMYQGGWGGGGSSRISAPLGGMDNFPGEKFSHPSDKQYIIIFGGLKAKSSCPKSFAQNLILEK